MDAFNLHRVPVLYWLVLAVLLIFALLLVAFGFSQFLGARLAPGLKFAILAPDTVFAGQTAMVKWDVSSENAKKYPTEKIELCRGQLLGAGCTTLLASTPNDGEATVTIPSFPAGKAYLRLTARSGKVLMSSLSGTRLVTVQVAGVGGGPVSQASVSKGGNITLTVGNPKVKKKVEICQQKAGKEACKLVAASVSGEKVTVKVPANAPVGNSYFKVTERSADGKATNKVLVQRAVTVKAQTAKTEESGGSGGGGSGGGGGGGGGGGSSGSGGGESASAPKAQFTFPASGETISDSSLSVRVKLSDTNRGELSCQQWLLDGVQLEVKDWVSGQAPAGMTTSNCF